MAKEVKKDNRSVWLSVGSVGILLVAVFGYQYFVKKQDQTAANIQRDKTALQAVAKVAVPESHGSISIEQGKVPGSASAFVPPDATNVSVAEANYGSGGGGYIIQFSIEKPLPDAFYSVLNVLSVMPGWRITTGSRAEAYGLIEAENQAQKVSAELQVESLGVTKVTIHAIIT